MPQTASNLASHGTFNVTLNPQIDPRLIEIFCEVTVVPGLSAEERLVADYVHAFLRRCGLESHEDSSHALWNGTAGNVLCTVGANTQASGTFLMSAHMDTPRPTKDTRVVIDHEKITSDGTTALGVDNRVGVALLLYALEQATHRVRTGTHRMNNATVMFTTCEETTLGGSMNVPLADTLQMGFVFDSSLRPGNFVRQSCGAIAFTARILGKAAHSGIAPEKGIHAIAAAALAVSRLQLGRRDETTTVNVGTIHGGEGVNVVPALAVVEGEIRSMNPAMIEALSKEIEAVFAAACAELGAELEFEARWDFVPYTIAPSEPVFERIAAAISSAGLTPAPQISWGGSDANSFNARGVRSVNIGIGAQNPHANSEFILLEDLQHAATIALALLTSEVESVPLQ
jgi:tripeptide aminopeptidase